MKKILILLGAFLLPNLALAQAGDNIAVLLREFQDLLGLVVPILIGVAVIVLLWGVVQMIAGAGDEEARKSGRQKIVWGIIGIVVMVSIWGLVIFVQDAFGIGDTDVSEIDIPELPEGNQ
jgi:NADH:ubiquinone oxidoreductase subunit 6 (subunit J)